MMWLLYLLLGLLGLAILLLLIAVIHTLTIGRSTRSAAKPAITFTEAERDKYVSDLSRMIQCETISLRGATDLSKFDDFHAVLAQLFPLIHEKLEKTEQAEQYLMNLGFRDFRVRLDGGRAKLQLSASDLPLVMEHREEIVHTLRKSYDGVLLDLEVRHAF